MDVMSTAFTAVFTTATSIPVNAYRGIYFRGSESDITTHSNDVIIDEVISTTQHDERVGNRTCHLLKLKSQDYFVVSHESARNISFIFKGFRAKLA